MPTTFQTLRAEAESVLLRAQRLARADHGEDDAKNLVNAVADACDALDATFAKRWGWDDDPAPAPAPAPPSSRIDAERFPAGSARDDVKWALDAISYDPQLARDLLRRALKGSPK